MLADTLQPGVDVSDCRSALRTGPTHCEDGEAPGQGAAAMRPLGASEAQLEDFLAHYGKPPREAVRALLEPSDDNIAALVRQQERTLTTAAYIAERMSQLQQAARDRARESLGGETLDPSALEQMRATLFSRPVDPSVTPALDSLQALATTYPALRCRVALVGAVTPNQLRRWIDRVSPPLDLTLAAEQDAAPGHPPFVRVDDLRDGRYAVLDAAASTATRLLSLMRRLRWPGSDAAFASAPPVAPSQPPGDVPGAAGDPPSPDLRRKELAP